MSLAVCRRASVSRTECRRRMRTLSLPKTSQILGLFFWRHSADDDLNTQKQPNAVACCRLKANSETARQTCERTMVDLRSESERGETMRWSEGSEASMEGILE